MNVYKLSNDLFKLVHHSKRCEGNRSEIIAHMLLLGVMAEEIEMGLGYLDNGCGVAHYGFGLLGKGPTFIFADKLAS